jgi:hypothetical protein
MRSAPRLPNADETAAGRALAGIEAASVVGVAIEPNVPAPNATVLILPPFRRSG